MWQFVKIIIATLHYTFFTVLGLFMATTGIRHFKGDPELYRWITSFGPGQWWAVPFILIGLFGMLALPFALAKGIVTNTSAYEILTQLGIGSRNKQIFFAFIAILIYLILIFCIIHFRIESLKLFWSVV